MTNDDRLAALEQRIAALEQATDRRIAAPEIDMDSDDALWALDGLIQRIDDPGGVLLTGSVRLPNGQLAQWQETRDADSLLNVDAPSVATVLAALGNSVRLRLIREVLGGRTTVSELVGTDGIGTTGQVYHHLRQLTSAGWLRSTGGGSYEVPIGRVVPLLGAILGAMS